MKRIACQTILFLLCIGTVLSACFAGVYAESGTSAYTYPVPEVMQLDIVMHPTAFLKMVGTQDEDGEKEVERKTFDAVLSVNAGEWQDVGIRLRGNPEFDSPGKRLPLEIRFDHVRSDDAYHGNPSLKLVKCHSPAQLFIQTVAMEAYRFLDIPTPEMTPALVRINDEDFGMYLAVEDINEAFIQKYFDGSGSLYRGHDHGEYLSGFSFLRTKVDHGNTTLEQMETAIVQRQPVDAYIHVDAFLRFIACEAFTFDSDGFFALHNYFLYDDDGRLVVLPWDKDLSFACFAEGNPRFGYTIRAFEHPLPEQNYILYSLMQNPEYRSRFYDYLTILNRDFLNLERFLPWLQNYIDALAPHLQRDPMVAQRSEDLYAYLTTGNQLYGSYGGNLLLTFQTIHTQLQDQIQDPDAQYHVPEKCTVKDYKMEQQVYVEEYAKGQDMIRRICENYWKMRRQFFWQEYGVQTIVIGCVFSAFLGLSIVSTHVSKGGLRHKKKREDVWNA